MFKRKLFFITFVAVHLLFIFLQVTKHVEFIHASYEKQKSEKLYTALIKEKDSLARTIQTLQNKDVIAQYARIQLGMKAMNLKQIKRLAE